MEKNNVTTGVVDEAIQNLKNGKIGDNIQDYVRCNHPDELVHELKPSDPHFTINVCSGCLTDEIERVESSIDRKRGIDELVESLEAAIDDVKKGDTYSIEEVKQRIENS